MGISRCGHVSDTALGIGIGIGIGSGIGIGLGIDIGIGIGLPNGAPFVLTGQMLASIVGQAPKWPN